MADASLRWAQVYDPLGNAFLSTLLAALPVVVLLGALAFLRALSAVRMALRELVFADIPDAELEAAALVAPTTLEMKGLLR